MYFKRFIGDIQKLYLPYQLFLSKDREQFSVSSQCQLEITMNFCTQKNSDCLTLMSYARSIHQMQLMTHASAFGL